MVTFKPQNRVAADLTTPRQSCEGGRGNEGIMRASTYIAYRCQQLPTCLAKRSFEYRRLLVYLYVYLRAFCLLSARFVLIGAGSGDARQGGPAFLALQSQVFHS